MKVGYARVSTTDLSLDHQIEELKKAGAEKIFEDKISINSTSEQEELHRAIQFMQEKDVLIVESLDRLGRNYDDIVHVVQRLDQKEVCLRVLNLSILNQELEDPNLQKLISNIIVQLLSWVAQNKREDIKHKQRQGIEIAKRKGHYKGRPMKYAADAKNSKDRMTYQLIVNKLKREEPIKKIAEDTGVTRDTVYRIKSELVDQ